MPQPSISGTPPAVNFGGSALPNGQGTMAWVNLNDRVNWFWMDGNAFAGIQRQVGIAQRTYLARGVYVADDFNATTVTLNLRYLETTNGDMGKALAQLEMADEQYLTFDNATYYKVKLSAVSNRTLLRTFQPYYWSFSLAFTVVHPWPRDFQAMGSSANLLNPNGGFEQIAGSNNTAMFDSFGGSGADGTLNAWTQDLGVFSIASNVVTVPASGGNSQMHAGHSDWADGRARLRFIFATSARPSLRVHWTATNNFIDCIVGAAFTTIILRKDIAGSTTNVTTSTAFSALVNGTAYWLEIVCAGTTYTSAIYNDSAGAIGAVIQTAAGTIADASVQTGYLSVGSAGTVSSFTCGGAFNDVCSWYADGHAWTQNIISGEPAFAMSAATFQGGAYSASVNNLASGANGYWSQGFTAGAGPYNYQGYIKATGAGTASINLSSAGPQSVTQDNTWRQTADANVVPGAGAKKYRAQMNGAGTAYFDNLTLQTSNDSTTGLYSQTFVDRVALLNGAGTTTSFSLTYPGSVFCEPVFTINVPSTSTGTLNQFTLTNTTSGEQLVIVFPSNLAGSTAYAFAIDTAAMTVTDTIHSKSYDVTGSFPRLYGPAGQVNTFTLQIASGSGTLSGLSLDTSFTPRWEI